MAGRSWLAMACHGWRWLVMPCLAMAAYGRPWLGMAAHSQPGNDPMALALALSVLALGAAGQFGISW